MGGAGSGGHNRKDAALRLVDGGQDHRPRRQHERGDGAALGSAPKHLSQPARDLWRQIAHDQPWLDRADRLLVENFVTATVARRACEAQTLDPNGAAIAAKASLHSALYRWYTTCQRLEATLAARRPSRQLSLFDAAPTTNEYASG